MIYNLTEQDILEAIGSYIKRKNNLNTNEDNDIGTYIDINWHLKNNKIQSCEVILLDILNQETINFINDSKERKQNE